MFRTNNRIWRKGLVCKSSSVASNQVIWQTRWYNKRILIKDYSVPWDFSWIENYKLSHRKYLFGRLCSLKGSYRPKNTSSFFTLSKLKWLTNCQNQLVCYRCSLLRWMFFIPCDNWKTWFFIKVCRYYWIFSTAILLLSLKKVFWIERSLYFTLSPQ